MRKFALLLALLLLGASTLKAQVNSPYKYGGRLNFVLMGGCSVYDSDFSEEFLYHHMTESFFSFLEEVAVGYNFTDAHEGRLILTSSRKPSLLPPEYGFRPYTFRSVSAFFDYLLNFEAVGEFYGPFSPKMYIGAGASYSDWFRLSWMDDEFDVDLRTRNLVPAFHLGTVLEYNFKNGIGFVFDFGLSYYLDRHNGLFFYSFPLDFELGAALGMIFRLKPSRNYKAR